MKIGGKESATKDQPLPFLKRKVIGEALDLEDAISRTQEFEREMDKLMLEKENENPNKIQNNSNRSLFTQETVRATTAKVLSSAYKNNQQNNEGYER